jgi:hypothetical protein
MNKEAKIRAAILGLMEERDRLKESMRTIDRSIRHFQSICDHDMQYEGHGHNFSLYKCSICEYKEKR